MPKRLKPLPYNQRALSPWMAQEAIRIQRAKQRRFIHKLNHLLADKPDAAHDLQHIVQHYAHEISHDDNATAIFYNAAQAWNFSFQWQSLRPAGGPPPAGPLAAQIDAQFGGLQTFAESFKLAAIRHFGRGWAWLVSDRGTPRILLTRNANTPTETGVTPLLVVAIWEHAYNLADHARRTAYIGGIVDHLLNWKFAQANYARALAREQSAADHSPAGTRRAAPAWMRA